MKSSRRSRAPFAGAGSIVVARNAGLTVADLETLRKQMKQAGGTVKVAKNRLAKLALKDTDTADMSALFRPGRRSSPLPRIP